VLGGCAISFRVMTFIRGEKDLLIGHSGPEGVTRLVYNTKYENPGPGPIRSWICFLGWALSGDLRVTVSTILFGPPKSARYAPQRWLPGLPLISALLKWNLLPLAHSRRT
jgi:hypothetical protein